MQPHLFKNGPTVLTASAVLLCAIRSGQAAHNHQNQFVRS
jgi:hypothetical protein